MNKALLGLVITTVAVTLVLLGFLLGSGWNKPSPEAKEKDNPAPTPTGPSRLSAQPPPPPPVRDDLRVRESLKPRRTYRVSTRLGFHMRGTDHDWGVLNSTITVNYWADAAIDRKIESNDGKTIVELRTFRKVASRKLDTKLEDVHIDLGAAGDFLLGGVALLKPEAAPFVGAARSLLEGRNLSAFLQFMGLSNDFVSDLVERDPRIRAVTAVGSLQGKTVRLTYRNEEGGGVQVDPVEGALTEDEKRFLASSVLLADSLIFPDVTVKVGDTWEADSMYFIGLIDPSMMLRPEGKLKLGRGPDVAPPARTGQKQKCVKINVLGGALNFHESSSRAEQVGHFYPQKGEMLFSPQDQIFIHGFFHGKGKLTITQKDHILFQARSKREPDLKVYYSCRLLGKDER